MQQYNSTRITQKNISNNIQVSIKNVKIAQNQMYSVKCCVHPSHSRNLLLNLVQSAELIL